MSLNNLYLKYLKRAHTMIGLFCIFFFFISAYFGTVILFSPYMNSWQNPSRHFSLIEHKDLNLDFAVNKALRSTQFSNEMIQIDLPSFRDKALGISSGMEQIIYLNPHTNKILQTNDEDNLITNFFNDIHIGRNIPMIGQLLMGLASISIIFLCFSGIYLWIKSKNTAPKKASFWFKWHKNFSLVLLPYILAFSLTGSVLGFMLTMSSPFALSITQGEEKSMKKLVGPIIFPKKKAPKKSTQDIDMIEYSKLYTQAQNIYPQLNIEKIILYRWYEKNAQIEFSGHLKNNRILTGKVNRMKLTLSGIDGSIIHKQTLSNTHIGNSILSSFYFLHFLPDEKIVIRIIYFILGIIFTLSLAFGFLIWTTKKASKNNNDVSYYSFMSRLGAAVMLGVIPASLTFIVLYWILPFDISEREIWLKGGFYTVWSFILFFFIYKHKILDAIKNCLGITALLLFIIPLLHGMKTNYYLWNSYDTGMNPIFYTDIGFLLLGCLFFILSFYLKKIKILHKYKENEYV